MLIGNACHRLEVEVTQPDSQTPLEFSAEIGPQQAYRTLGVSFGKTLQVQSPISPVIRPRSVAAGACAPLGSKSAIA